LAAWQDFKIVSRGAVPFVQKSLNQQAI